MKLEDVIGQTAEGNPITVGEALMGVVELKKTLDTLAEDSETQLKEGLRNVRASLNAKLGQKTWGELASVEWGDLKTERWGHVQIPV